MFSVTIMTNIWKKNCSNKGCPASIYISLYLVIYVISEISCFTISASSLGMHVVTNSYD